MLNDPDPVAASSTSTASRDVERARINLGWLWKLRWAGVIGQVVTILFVQHVYDAGLATGPLFFVILVTATTNVVFGRVGHRALRRNELDRFGEEGEWLIGLVTVTDLVLLTAMLYLSGGPDNPFAIFYFVHLVLAAVILPPRWTWSLTVLTVTCYAALFFEHVDVAIFHDPASETIMRQGLLVAFAIASCIIVYFVTRVGSELAERERELELARQRRSRVERVEALVTLAAGAAHELSTPLSTIAVIAKELENDLAAGRASAQSGDDVRLIRREVQRCRAILEQMSASSGDIVGEAIRRISVAAFMDAVLEPLRAGARVDLSLDPELEDRDLEGPPEALRRAVRGLVKNALDASPPDARVDVELTARRAGSRVEIAVRDRGEGMDERTLALAGDPFFTTKEPGRGMGLGLYLARTVIERLDGRLEIDSLRGVGTTALVDLPLAPLVRPPA